MTNIYAGHTVQFTFNLFPHVSEIEAIIMIGQVFRALSALDYE